MLCAALSGRAHLERWQQGNVINKGLWPYRDTVALNTAEQIAVMETAVTIIRESRAIGYLVF